MADAGGETVHGHFKRALNRLHEQPCHVDLRVLYEGRKPKLNLSYFFKVELCPI